MGNFGNIGLVCGCVISLVELMTQPHFYPWGKISEQKVVFDRKVQYGESRSILKYLFCHRDSIQDFRKSSIWNAL